jgi:predicted CoA-binding protein
MVSKERLDAFVRGQRWAVVGASADRSKFGNINVWFQPGAESDEALAYCEAHGLEAIAGHCILRTPEQD